MITEEYRTYRTLKAARIAAAVFRKQDNITRCNVFLKSIMLKSGMLKRDKRGRVVALPAVYIVRSV